MAYTINLTNGTVLTTIADGTVTPSSVCSLTLIGKNYSGYGTFLNDNLVHLLENSSNDTAPSAPLAGQIWWDTAGNLKVYTGSAFKTLGATFSSSTQPTNAVTGNGWWDTGNQQFNIYNGSGWTLVGPAFSSNTGTSGTIVGTILDASSAPHVAVNVYVSNTLVGIISKDSTYTPQTSITGFSTVKPGFNLASNSAIAGIGFWGTASDASALNGVSSTNFARTDAAAVFNNTLTVNYNSGLIVGTNNDFVTSVSGSTVYLTQNTNNGDLVLRANVGGAVTTALTVVGTTGAVSASGYLLAAKNEAATSTTTGALRVTGGAGVTGNVYAGGNIYAGNVIASGNVTANYLVGTAIQSLYADLAERFSSDSVYEPGTVVELGGYKEITMSQDELSEDVFGVISAKPGFVMNSNAGSDDTHPAVAVNGRVPVKVVGKIKKGDRLVSAGNGLARSGLKSELSPFNVIGRSLEDKDDLGTGVVLAIVKLNS